MVWFYRVARPSEYLAITGLGVRDIRLAKKAWNLPGQSCRVIDISPVKYTFNVKAMSAEKLPFILHAVFTIGPRTEDKYSLSKYARLIFQQDKQSTYLNDLVHSSIECHVCALSASMTMEEIFCSTKLKNELCEKVELELERSGLTIYNAIVQQLEDVVSQDYFSFLRTIMMKQKEVDAVLYQQKRQAETELYIQQQKADGELYVKKREAEGLDSLTQSQDRYLRMLERSFGLDYYKLRDYLMASWKVCPNIAKTSADTFKGLLEGTS